MKKLQVLRGIARSMALAFLITACAPTATPELPTATLIPIVTETAIPTLVPVTLSGPTAGSLMSWMDGSSLVYVPAGQFTMGASGVDNPSHAVSLSAYWISRTKITNHMYTLCVGVGVCSPPAVVSGGPVYSNPVYADHPVVGVNWEQANAYCGWVGGRLPTEAEWEKAARGPGGQTYPWGNENPSCDLLNYAGCLGSTSSVIAYPESASLYLTLDMAGNAFEWVWDWYDASYYATSPIQDPPGADSGIYRVIRGSSFESDSTQLDSAIRRPADPTSARRDTGFRCVVQQPINFPPYCQASPYLPIAEIPTPVANTCQAPVAQRIGPSCKGKIASHTILLPLGSTYRVQSAGYDCTSVIVNEMLQVTCTGPDATSGTLEVCNSTCGEQPAPAASSQSAVCDPGYSFDPATRQCVYTPLAGQSGPQGCPPGYALDSTGQVCRPTIGLDNQCPSGQYYDSLFGGCVPANGQANCNFYGLNDAALASTCYPGCPAGFAFNSASQCCQAPAIGLYPDCQPGLAYDPSLGACAPRLEQASGNSGCAFVSVDMLQCAPPFDCGQFTKEAHCVQNRSMGCTWNEKAGACENKK
jgi:sulfatase modifying factor 1